ncbi:conserved hypothetical protein [Ricinus communis]|uniref:Uncharacterized protein n=1 Tax=Ricinus communis TaxID=3988 RepID=B9S9N9_RICCO|nr:conserved hypothetical protein [Ricinus communis]
MSKTTVTRCIGTFHTYDNNRDKNDSKELSFQKSEERRKNMLLLYANMRLDRLVGQGSYGHFNICLKKARSETGPNRSFNQGLHDLLYMIRPRIPSGFEQSKEVVMGSGTLKHFPRMGRQDILSLDDQVEVALNIMQAKKKERMDDFELMCASPWFIGNSNMSV